MTARHLAALVLLWAGTAGVCFACLGALLTRQFADRLHFLGPANVLGAPLVVLGMVLDETLGRLTVKLLVIGAVVGLAGPVTTMATARAGLPPGHGGERADGGKGSDGGGEGSAGGDR